MISEQQIDGWIDLSETNGLSPESEPFRHALYDCLGELLRLQGVEKRAAALRRLLGSLPVSEVELVRETWGNTNIAVLLAAIVAAKAAFADIPEPVSNAEWRALAQEGARLIAAMSRDSTFYPAGGMDRFLEKARKMGLEVPHD